MIKMSVGDKTTSARVFVVTTKSTPLLGLNTRVALGLLQKGDNVQCDKCNSKAKDIMYELNMNQDSDDTVKKCSICATVRRTSYHVKHACVIQKLLQRQAKNSRTDTRSSVISMISRPETANLSSSNPAIMCKCMIMDNGSEL